MRGPSVLCAALVLAAAGPAGAQRTTAGPLQAIYGEQHIPLAFDHAVHLGKAKMKCDECHDVAKSVRPSERNLPPEATCLDCHDVLEAAPEKASPPAACATCHPGYEPTFPEGVERDDTKKATPHPPAVELPTASIQFSHQAHLQRGATCEDCHAGVASAGLATLDHLPMMDQCLACHDGRQASAACNTCHLAGPDGKLTTRLPGGKLVPRGLFRNDDHRGDFARSHGPAAKADAGYCASCHTESECAACHTGHVKPLSLHAADYVLTHPMEARRNDPDCTRCHRLQTFCRDCHLRSGVTMAAIGGFGFRDAANTSGGRFHPPGWADIGTLPTSSHHRYEARRNLRQCVACHQESDCLSCHATPERMGSGFSPHPPGFERSCGRALRVNDRGCRQCHADRAALEARCD